MFSSVSDHSQQSKAPDIYWCVILWMCSF